jgi:hypothetical protein
MIPKWYLEVPAVIEGTTRVIVGVCSYGCEPQLFRHRAIIGKTKEAKEAKRQLSKK